MTFFWFLNPGGIPMWEGYPNTPPLGFTGFTVYMVDMIVVRDCVFRARVAPPTRALHPSQLSIVLALSAL